MAEKAISRTDPHRPSALDPTAYDFEAAFHLATTHAGWPVPAVGVETVVALRKKAVEEGVRFAPVHSATNACDVCGAWFMFGEVWRHRPTGDYVTVGNVCAEKYGLVADAVALKKVKRERAAMVRLAKRYAKRALRRRRNAAAARDVLRADPELRSALTVRDGFIRDIARSIVDRGAVTDKMRAAVLRAADRVRNAVPEPPAVPIPEGYLAKRVKVEGVVLGAKVVDHRFGSTLKMLVRVDAEGGAFKLWGTAPDAILWRASDLGAHPRKIRGARIRFAARVKVSESDPTFGIFSRPTKAEVLAEGAEEARYIEESNRAREEAAREDARENAPA